MSALALRSPADDGRGRWALAALLAWLVAAGLVFAHGCHGADADHEPLIRVRGAEFGSRSGGHAPTQSTPKAHPSHGWVYGDPWGWV